MSLPNITKIDINWNHGWANAPQVEITVDGKMPEPSEWIYQATTDWENDPTMLISRNFDPWVRFVYISKRDGQAQFDGALGGDYRLTNGEVLKSRTGWSSRASVINVKYSTFIPDDILEPTLIIPSKYGAMKWAGYAVTAKYIREHELWPKDIYLVIDNRRNDEVHYAPSIDPTEVRKPNG